MRLSIRAATGVAIASFGFATSALAQSVLIADRTTDSIWLLIDTDVSGSIDQPPEIIKFFDGLNTQGTLAPSNPSALAVRSDGAVVMGDQGNRAIYLLRDRNDDHDCQDAGESIIYADATNASGVSFAFPTGAAFGPDAALYIVNASNTFGDDALYRLVDLNADGDAQDVGEITVYAGPNALGGTSTNYSPQEICFIGSTMYLHNSNGSTPSRFGVYRLDDSNMDTDSEDPGEFNFIGPVEDGLGGGLAGSAGFAMEPDWSRERSVFILQLASGGVDQLVRLTDSNADGDAFDPGESVLAWSTAESGFTSVDCFSPASGSGAVCITDNSGKRIIRLVDMDADGLFDNSTEREDFFLANAGPVAGQVSDIRQIAFYPICKADANADGGVTIDDLLLFLNYFGIGDERADLDDGTATANPDGGVTIDDLIYFLSRFGAGC